MRILTERTELRLLSEADIPWVVALLAEVSPDRPAMPDWHAQAARALRDMMGEYTKVGYGDYLVVGRGDGQPMGYGGFRSLTPDHAEANIAISLPPAQQGKGLGRELLAALKAKAPEFGIRVLHAFIRPQNQPSLRLFASAGFRYEGMTQNEQQLQFQHFVWRY